MKWTKNPSVSAGGKQYFWTGVKAGVRYWVAWDRAKRMWTVDKEKRSGGFAKGLGLFKTAEAGKIFVESL